MKPVGLRGRFVVAGVLLVATSAASSAWSAWAFRRVGQVVDATLRDSEETTAATAALATDLEREDDALLLTLTDEVRGRRELAPARATVEAALKGVEALLTGPGERGEASRLRADVGAYHGAGDELVARAAEPSARTSYHEQVNPLLRRAVADAARIRDDHFRSTQQVAALARDQSARATQVLAGVFAATLLLSLFVAFYLARVVVFPIGELTRAVDAIREGDFDRRVTVPRQDELGRLAEGFNRMADDLTEFRRANIGEVLRAKDTLEATLAALPDAVVVIESEGLVSSANPRASEIIRAARGSSAQDVRELPVPEATRAAIHRALQGTITPPSVDLSKVMTVAIDHQQRRFLPRVVPVEGRGVVLLLSDVTDLVRLDEMRLELVAVASHELRTPLTTLRMTLLMLQERAERLDPRDRELVATALLGVEQLATTVAEFLDLTRIEAGQLRLHLDRVDVSPLLARAVEGAKPAAEDARVAVALDVSAGAPRAVWGDAARLGVVLSNILGNAIKYAPGGSTIAVTADAAAHPARLRVVITDAGPGVPPQFRERIFDKFFRVEHHVGDPSEGVRGSGIGLYVAREIVEAHGGTIQCAAAEGTPGARFVLLLPVERSVLQEHTG